MDEQQVVLLRLTGERLQVERYQCTLRAWSIRPLSQEALRRALAECRPAVVFWQRGDDRAAALASDLCAGRALQAGGSEDASPGPAWIEVGPAVPFTLSGVLAALTSAASGPGPKPPPAAARPAGPPADAPERSAPPPPPADQRPPDLGAALELVLAHRARKRAQGDAEGIAPGSSDD